MNDAAEQDLILLESYLDDALTQWEAEQVRARLASDSKFAATMHELRAERDVRAAAWSSIGAEAGNGEAFAESVVGRVRSIDRWKRFRRATFVASAAAACFVAGWAGHLLISMSNGPAQTSSVAIHSEGKAGSTKLVSSVEGPGAFQVILTDQAGKVLAIQKFTKLDEARQFANELSQFRSQQEHVRQGQMVLISDEF